MQRNKQYLYGVLLLLTLYVGSFMAARAQSPVAQNGQLQIIGQNLCDQYGNPIQLRGMSSHGIQWYGWGNCLTDASLDVVADEWGADIFRVAMYIQEDGYETDPNGFTSQMKTLIDEVTERGMYALIDWHILTPGDPNENLTAAKTFFTEIANTYKDQENIIYEICNEPNGDVTWSMIKSYAEQLIPVIRAIDDDAIIIVGTPGWSSLGLSAGSSASEIVNNPLSYDNIMYTFHFYAASHQDYYYNEFDWASDRLPIFVTEFGTQESSGDGANDFTMAQRYIDLMQEKKISWTNWNYSDNPLSGAAWTSGTCSTGPWTTDNLKEAGLWIRERIMSPADDFPGGSDDGDNLALNKTVTVSSVEEAGYEGTYAVDGSTATRWSSTLYSDPEWIFVDLGASYNLTQVSILWEAAYASSYTVDVSDDATTWTTIKTITDNSSLTNTHSDLTATGRYVRINCTARGSEYGYSIYELRAYGTAANTGDNLALNKTVSVSSVEEAGFEGAYAVDGSTATRWSSELYSDSEWIYVDLGASYSINTVEVLWEAAYASSYTVDVSDDATTWTTVKSITSNGSLTNTHTDLSTTGRYVRINCSARGSEYGYSIYELRVYGTAASTGNNLALSKTVSVSSVEEAGFEGNYAVDGSTTTRWSSTLYSDSEWLYVDLGTTYTITEVKVIWEAAYAANYTVDVSDDAATWTTVKTITGNSALTNDHTGLNATGRYVRINCTARGSDYGYSIYELEVYSAAASATAAVTEATLTAAVEEMDVVAYPNPVEDEVTLRLSDYWTGARLAIVDSTGDIVKDAIIKEATPTISLKDVPTGIYIIEISKGGHVIKRRISKK